VLSNSTAAIPASGAWIDPSINQEAGFETGGAVMFGRWNDYSGTCDTWTHSSTSYAGMALTTSGELTNTYTCNTPRPLACCSGMAKTAFAGFTSSNAPMTGRPGMHAACATQFPGSHMCHAAEYVNTISAAPIPASGAWLDPSVTLTGDFTIGGAPSFGRWVDYGGTCDSWIHTSTSYSGLFLTTSGEMANSYTCHVPRPVACCM
jgi:hypothetical protein